jgi:hypothetical protein
MAAILLSACVPGQGGSASAVRADRVGSGAANSPPLRDGTPDSCPESAPHLPAPGGRCEPPFLHVTRDLESEPVSACHINPARGHFNGFVFFLVRGRSAGVVTNADVLVRIHADTAYRVERSSPDRGAILGVSAEDGAALSPERAEEARLVRALAAAVVGWPGAAVASRAHAKGEDAPELDAAVTKTLDLQLHTLDLQLHDEPAPVVSQVRFREAAIETWGEALAFDVVVDSMATRQGDSFRWTTAVHASGELVLRASDGAIVALRLRGSVTDTEVLEREPVMGSGLSREPRTCNRGELSFEIGWDCSQCLAPGRGPETTQE